ncbi:MAG: S8 family serine peptidase, partial [Candidatus Heimdallarchaeota archaeon]|nr:S8 family serine peptidase [Candidatus Heimdallarchaeota archaeon]MCK4613052.1 S8 family serine peptidase [Candidatus Heimdallarchaeota archaeon]
MNKAFKHVLATLLLIVLFSLNYNSAVSKPDITLPPSTKANDVGWHLPQISIYGAWEKTYGNEDIIVAIIDSGIDFSHPQLEGKSWNNTDEIPDNGIDDDSNGYIDDVAGWDFVSNDNIPGPEAADPVHWHATFISGILAAPLDGIGVAGVAPNVTIMDIRVLDSLNYAGTTLEGFGDAIRYAVENGADVINLSLHYYSESELYHDDITYAVDQNIPVVSVTGNTPMSSGGGRYYQSFPGGYDNVISVGATSYWGDRADFSNFGPWTELVAPVGDQGVNNIRSTFPPDTYATGWGTSFACPQVVGVIALMRSINHTMSVGEIREILHETADDLGDEGKDDYFGYGMVNATA